MLINIHDSHLEKVGFLDSESPGAPGFFNDVEHHYLAEGASTFTFSVNKKKNGILQDYCQFLNEDAYFSFSENGEDHFYSVGTVDEDNDTTFTVTCYSLNLELRLEQCDPLENTASHNIQWYFDQMGLINNTQITIGINEVSDLSRVIKYDGQESKLARLISLIGNFDAEFEFITKSNNDGTLDKIILNIYKENDGVNFQGVGTNRDDVILTLDTNITGVSRTVDKTQIFNATTITGADGLTWNSSEFSYVNSDGVEEFYKRKNADTAFAPLSLAKYPSQIQSSTGDRWIRKNFTTDYTSANAIWGYAVSQFKKFAYGIVTYKVSVSSLLVNSEVGNGLPLKIGDTVTISDDNFIDSNGVRGLILSARVSEMEISRTDPTKNTLVFSNYIRLQSQISNDLQSQLSNLVDAATPYIGSISTTNGTQFKNGTGSTTLSAHIFKGSATTETTADSYEWSKDGTIIANAQTITVDASGVADKAVYSFKATVGGKVVASQSMTITNVNDGKGGADGKTSYTHVAYANSSDSERNMNNWLLSDPAKQATKITYKDGVNTIDYKGVADFEVFNFPVKAKKGQSFTFSFSWTQPDIESLDGTANGVPVSIADAPLISSQIGRNVIYLGVSKTSSKLFTISGTATADKTYVSMNLGYLLDGIQWQFQISYQQDFSKDPVNHEYLGWYSDFTANDSTDPSKYAWSLIKGDKGDKGDTGANGKDGIDGLQGKDGQQGIPGKDGADGKTQYTHIAYANSADGVTDFSTYDSNRTYMGVYVDFNVNDSTTPSDYSWTLVKGADGTQGIPGKAGADGKTPYFHTAWSYSIDGTNGFTTVYPNLNLGDDTKTFAGATGAWGSVGGSIYTEPDTQKTQDGDFNYLTYKPTRDNVDWFRFFLGPDPAKPNITKVSVMPNTNYTFSVWLKGTGKHTIYAYGSWTAPNTPWYLDINLTSDWRLYTFTVMSKDVMPNNSIQFFIRSYNGTEINLKKPKVEPGSVATPYMQSASEVTTANWPSYIGQYTDFTQADSTNPSAYTWSLMRGNDGKDGIAGKDGVGIKATVITYAISTSGTIAPTTGWTSSVPSLVKGQYLWTKTVWTYTDNSSETGYSVTYISKDGNNGNDGIAGKDGTGIKTTTITYAGSTNGTTAPTSGWTATVPTVAAGSYLWTKTVWAYTDNTSETGYSVAMMGVKGERGKQIFKSSYESVPHNNGHYWSDLSPAPSIDNPPKIGDTVITPSGNILQIDTVNVGGGGGGGTFGVGDVLGNIKGPSGSNGDPGKIVSDTEPTTRFKGLTWKYSGTTDLTASDGTVILSGTEYYWSGTNWILSEINAHNINGNNLKITDGAFVSTTTNGLVTTSTEIKDNHIAISKTDGTVKTKNDIALDSEQGLAQKFTNIDTGFYRTAGINYQGPFTSDSVGNYAQLTPQGTKLSTDVPWTKLSLMNNFTGNIEYAIINGTVYISASGVGVPAMTAGQWNQAAQLPTGSSAIPIRANRITAGDSGDGLSWALLSNQAGGIFIRCSANKVATANLFNATLAYPIG